MVQIHTHVAAAFPDLIVGDIDLSLKGREPVQDLGGDGIIAAVELMVR